LSNGEEQKAEQLRKDGNYTEAKPIFKELWEEKKNPTNAAQYLHCIRKLKEKKEAVQFADELKKMNLKNSWVNIEILWTLLLFDLKTKQNFYEARDLAKYLEELLLLNPNKIGNDILIGAMVKIACDNDKWEDALFWLGKVSEDRINDEQVTKTEWTNKSLWFFRKTKCLIKLGRCEEGLAMFDEYDSTSLPWGIKKLFLRYKAKALADSGDVDQALALYENLTKGKGDWFVRYEKGKLLLTLDKKEEALLEFYTAASSFRQLDKLVTLFDNIGDLCLKLKKVDVALAHFILEKLVREENGWKIDQNLSSFIASLLPSVPQYKQLTSVKDALSICREFWKEAGVQAFDNKPKQSKRVETRKKRNGLFGSITGLNPEKSFCFILTDNDETIFCLKSDIKDTVSNYDEVTFDAITSFDRSKNKESWKAVNVRKY